MSCWQILQRTKGGHISLDIYTSLTLPVSGCDGSCWVKFISKECFPAVLGDNDSKTATVCEINKGSAAKTNWELTVFMIAEGETCYWGVVILKLHASAAYCCEKA